MTINYEHFVNAHCFDQCLMICNKTRVLGKRSGSSLSLSVVHFRAALAGIWFSVNVRLPVAALPGGGSPPPIVFGRLRIKAHVSRKNTLNLCFPPLRELRLPSPFTNSQQQPKSVNWISQRIFARDAAVFFFVFFSG